MQLLVIRHAVAEDAGPDLDDSERALTEAGRAKLRRAVRGLRALEIRIERILTSPWKRAVKGMRALGWQFDRVIASPWRRAFDTAQLLAPLCDADPIPTDLLVQSPRAELLAMIAERGETTAVVGHEPWLGELVAWLAFGDTRHGDALAIKKAGVVWLEGSAVPGGMQIRAALPPRVLRAIG